MEVLKDHAQAVLSDEDLLDIRRVAAQVNECTRCKGSELLIVTLHRLHQWLYELHELYLVVIVRTNIRPVSLSTIFTISSLTLATFILCSSARVITTLK